MKMNLSHSVRLLILLGAVIFGGHVHANQDLLIGGGSVHGLYFKVTQHLCNLINRHSLNKYQCSGRPALGSVFNINAIADGLLDFGIAQSDRSWQATNGRADWDGKPVTGLRSIFSLHPETVILAARQDAGIRSLTDLRGKRVNIGNPGSGQRGNAEDILRLHGISAQHDFLVHEQQQHEASLAIVERKIDAFFYTAGNPSRAITVPAKATDLRLIPLNSEAILNFVSGKTYYMMTEIPAHTYQGVDTSVPTYGVRANLMSSTLTPDDVVYEVVRIVFEHLDELRAVHPALNELTPNIMLSALSAPLHPGAERYYRERGWILSDSEN